MLDSSSSKDIHLKWIRAKIRKRISSHKSRSTQWNNNSYSSIYFPHYDWFLTPLDYINRSLQEKKMMTVTLPPPFRYRMGTLSCSDSSAQRVASSTLHSHKPSLQQKVQHSHWNVSNPQSLYVTAVVPKVWQTGTGIEPTIPGLPSIRNNPILERVANSNGTVPARKLSCTSKLSVER